MLKETMPIISPQKLKKNMGILKTILLIIFIFIFFFVLYWTVLLLAEHSVPFPPAISNIYLSDLLR